MQKLILVISVTVGLSVLMVQGDISSQDGAGSDDVITIDKPLDTPSEEPGENPEKEPIENREDEVITTVGDPGEVIYTTSTFEDVKRNNRKPKPVRVVAQREYRGTVQGNCGNRRSNSGLVRFSVRKGVLNGTVNSGSQGMAMSGSVAPNGVVMGRLSNGSVFKGRLQNGAIVGSINGGCKGSLAAGEMKVNGK